MLDTRYSMLDPRFPSSDGFAFLYEHPASSIEYLFLPYP